MLEILRRQLPCLRQMTTAIDLIAEAGHKNKFSEQLLHEFFKIGESIWDVWVEILECIKKWHTKGDVKDRDTQVKNLERNMELLTKIIIYWNLGFEKEIWRYHLSISPFHSDSFQMFQEDLRVDAIIDMVSSVLIIVTGFTAEPSQSPYITHLWKDLEQVRALMVGTKFPKEFEMKNL